MTDTSALRISCPERLKFSSIAAVGAAFVALLSFVACLVKRAVGIETAPTVSRKQLLSNSSTIDRQSLEALADTIASDQREAVVQPIKSQPDSDSATNSSESSASSQATDLANPPATPGRVSEAETDGEETSFPPSPSGSAEATERSQPVPLSQPEAAKPSISIPSHSWKQPPSVPPSRRLGPLTFRRQNVNSGSLKQPRGLATCVIREDMPYPPANAEVTLEVRTTTVRHGRRLLRYSSSWPLDTIYIKIPNTAPASLHGPLLESLRHTIDMGSQRIVVGAGLRPGCALLSLDLLQLGGHHQGEDLHHPAQVLDLELQGRSGSAASTQGLDGDREGSRMATSWQSQLHWLEALAALCGTAALPADPAAGRRGDSDAAVPGNPASDAAVPGNPASDAAVPGNPASDAAAAAAAAALAGHGQRLSAWLARLGVPAPDGLTLYLQYRGNIVAAVHDAQAATWRFTAPATPRPKTSSGGSSGAGDKAAEGGSGLGGSGGLDGSEAARAGLLRLRVIQRVVTAPAEPGEALTLGVVVRGLAGVVLQQGPARGEQGRGGDGNGGDESSRGGGQGDGGAVGAGQFNFVVRALGRHLPVEVVAAPATPVNVAAVGGLFDGGETGRGGPGGKRDEVAGLEDLDSGDFAGAVGAAAPVAEAGGTGDAGQGRPADPADWRSYRSATGDLQGHPAGRRAGSTSGACRFQVAVSGLHDGSPGHPHAAVRSDGCCPAGPAGVSAAAAATASGNACVGCGGGGGGGPLLLDLELWDDNRVLVARRPLLVLPPSASGLADRLQALVRELDEQDSLDEQLEQGSQGLPAFAHAVAAEGGAAAGTGAGAVKGAVPESSDSGRSAGDGAGTCVDAFLSDLGTWLEFVHDLTSYSATAGCVPDGGPQPQEQQQSRRQEAAHQPLLLPAGSAPASSQDTHPPALPPPATPLLPGSVDLRGEVLAERRRLCDRRPAAVLRLGLGLLEALVAWGQGSLAEELVVAPLAALGYGAADVWRAFAPCHATAAAAMGTSPQHVDQAAGSACGACEVEEEEAEAGEGGIEGQGAAESLLHMAAASGDLTTVQLAVAWAKAAAATEAAAQGTSSSSSGCLSGGCSMFTTTRAPGPAACAPDCARPCCHWWWWQVDERGATPLHVLAAAAAAAAAGSSPAALEWALLASGPSARLAWREARAACVVDREGARDAAAGIPQRPDAQQRASEGRQRVLRVESVTPQQLAVLMGAPWLGRVEARLRQLEEEEEEEEEEGEEMQGPPAAGGGGQGGCDASCPSGGRQDAAGLQPRGVAPEAAGSYGTSPVPSRLRRIVRLLVASLVGFPDSGTRGQDNSLAGTALHGTASHGTTHQETLNRHHRRTRIAAPEASMEGRYQAFLTAHSLSLARGWVVVHLLLLVSALYRVLRVERRPGDAAGPLLYSSGYFLMLALLQLDPGCRLYTRHRGAWWALAGLMRSSSKVPQILGWVPVPASMLRYVRKGITVVSDGVLPSLFEPVPLPYTAVVLLYDTIVTAVFYGAIGYTTSPVAALSSAVRKNVLSLVIRWGLDACRRAAFLRAVKKAAAADASAAAAARGGKQELALDSGGKAVAAQRPGEAAAEAEAGVRAAGSRRSAAGGVGQWRWFGWSGNGGAAIKSHMD